MTRLRVAVPARIAETDGASGYGRVWTHLLRALASRVDLVLGDASVASDVWLVDGHSPLPDPGPRPVVALVHDVRWVDPAHRDELPLTFLASIVPDTARAVATATLIVVPADAVRDAVVAGYGIDAARVTSIPHGVDLDVFAPRPRLAGGVPYVCFVGAVEPRKNVGVVRAAVGVLADRGLPHRLVLRCNPAPWVDSRALLTAATAELPGHPGRVVVLPRLDDDDLAWVLAGADALCLPSTCEGFGLPVLEAMACGTPVVVADRGALPEVVGDAGIVTEPTVDAVADALTSLVDDPDGAEALGARARARATGFTWAATADAYVETLAAAVDAHRVPTWAPVRVPDPAWLPVRAVDRCPVCGTAPDGPPVERRRCPVCGCTWAARVLDETRFVEPVPRRLPDDWHGVALPDDVADVAGRAAACGRLAVLASVARPPGTLLDLRAGSGFLVDAATRAGWDAHDAAAPTDRFDVVIAARGVDEDIDVTAALHRLAASARPGGHVLVEVPNWASATRRRDGDRWHHLRPLERVAYFDPPALRVALERAGLDPVRIVVRTWPVDDLDAATHALTPLRRPLRQALRPARAAGARSRRAADAAVGTLRAGYDAAGLGDVIVAIARVPVNPSAGDGPRPRRDGARS